MAPASTPAATAAPRPEPPDPGTDRLGAGDHPADIGRAAVQLGPDDDPTHDRGATARPGAGRHPATADQPTARIATTTGIATDDRAPTTSPPTTIDVSALCAQLESQKKAIEAEIKRVEQVYKDDPATRDRLKAELEAQKHAIEQQRKALHC